MMSKEFLRVLLQGELLGQRCRDCGTYICPPKTTCDNCGSRNLEIIKMMGKGKIKSFTTIYVPPIGYERDAPYVIAMVQLDEGPWIVGRVDLDYKQVEKYGQSLIGKDVKVIGREISVRGSLWEEKVIIPVFVVKSD